MNDVQSQQLNLSVFTACNCTGESKVGGNPVLGGLYCIPRPGQRA